MSSFNYGMDPDVPGVRGQRFYSPGLDGYGLSGYGLGGYGGR